MRTLSGHRLNCIAMDFHPFGEFFASGSRDTNLKIWDIRRKRCIHTYKGHDHGINAVKFSPDGRWVVSGGEDNVAKVGTRSLTFCVCMSMSNIMMHIISLLCTCYLGNIFGAFCNHEIVVLLISLSAPIFLFFNLGKLRNISFHDLLKMSDLSSFLPFFHSWVFNKSYTLAFHR